MSEPEYRAVNLDAVDAPNKNVLEAALTTHWSGYTAEPTARARDPWKLMSKQTINTETASYANVHDIPNTDDYALRPGNIKGSNSLPIHWAAGGEFTVNLRKVLKLAGVSITKGYRLIIPVEFKTLPDLGPCMVLRITHRRQEKINQRKASGSARASAGGATAG